MSQRHLPLEIIEKIGDFADIDTRRALGLQPRKLNKTLLARADELLKRQLYSRFYYNDHVFTTVLPIQIIDKNTTVTALFIWFDTLFDTMTFMVTTSDMSSIKTSKNKSYIFATVSRMYYVNPKRSIDPVYNIYNSFDLSTEMITMTEYNANYCLEFETR